MHTPSAQLSPGPRSLTECKADLRQTLSWASVQFNLYTLSRHITNQTQEQLCLKKKKDRIKIVVGEEQTVNQQTKKSVRGVQLLASVMPKRQLVKEWLENAIWRRFCFCLIHFVHFPSVPQ